MTVMAPRSSTTASVSRKARSATGRRRPTTASTASAKAMSVAMGMPQPVSEPSAIDRVDGHEDARRHDHAADRCSRRDHRLADLRERAEDELVLELEPDDEEEHRQQAVGRPDSQREVEVQRDWADLEVHEGEVRVGPRGVGPHQCDCRGDQQQHAADGLVAQALAEIAELEDRRSAQELVGAAHHGAFRLADMRACIADQASRRTRAFGRSLRDLNPPTWRLPARRRSGPSPRDRPGSSRRRGRGSRRRRAGGGA